MLGGRPVNIGTHLNIRRPCFQDTDKFRIERHMIWRCCYGLANPAQDIQLNRRLAASLNTMRRAHSRPASLQPIGLVWSVTCTSFKFIIEISQTLINDFLRTRLIKHTFGN